MIGEADTRTASPEASEPRSIDRLYSEGIMAGLLGAAAVAVWFFLIDALRGRPFHTPTVLGLALFRGGEGLGQGAAVPASVEMVVLYTWVHALVFCVLGGVASRLLDAAEREPNAGFGVVLLLVILLFGFLGIAAVFAGDVVRALTWPAILSGNLIAAGVMALYLRRRHPALTIWP
jgi:hypothetical protein